jgi:hypothetical protein
VKINPDIVNDVTCRHEIFYYKILCIVIYTKITKSDKIRRFKVYILRSTHLSFLCSPNYNLIFVSIFFDTQNYDFQFF